MSARRLAAVRTFARAEPAPVAARCDLCALPIGDAHDHLVSPGAGELACACLACALLFPDGGGGRLRRVPRRLAVFDADGLDDLVWARLGIPIAVAFLLVPSNGSGPLARYPGPAGLVEAPVDSDAWDALAEVTGAPRSESMAPDVEALLLYRARRARAVALVSVDRCFELAGLIRSEWRGLDGGPRVWRRVEQLVSELGEAGRA